MPWMERERMALPFLEIIVVDIDSPLRVIVRSLHPSLSQTTVNKYTVWNVLIKDYYHLHVWLAIKGEFLLILVIGPVWDLQCTHDLQRLISHWLQHLVHFSFCFFSQCWLAAQFRNCLLPCHIRSTPVYSFILFHFGRFSGHLQSLFLVNERVFFQHVAHTLTSVEHVAHFLAQSPVAFKKEICSSACPPDWTHSVVFESTANLALKI